jgi:uncharacterized transporter YbjL
MKASIKSLAATAGAILVLMVFVVIEVVVAMLAYMYLALNHSELFGYLVGLSLEALNVMARQLETFSPQLANRAYATLLGELGPKSILLLLIGLTVSAVGRLAGWMWRRWTRKAEPVEDAPAFRRAVR